MHLYRKKSPVHGQHYAKNELGLNNNDYLFWLLLGSLQRECRQTFHSIIGHWMKGSDMRISWHPLTSFLMGLKTTKTQLVIHCNYIACVSTLERMHPLFVQVEPFCQHEIRPVSGNEYTGHWLNFPILEICPKVVEHSLVKAKGPEAAPPSPPCPNRVLNENFLLQLMKQIPLQSLLPSALFEVVVLFSWFLQLPCCTNCVQLSFKRPRL